MESRRYILTYNGEIYNYRDLQQYLYVNDDLAIKSMGNDAWTLLEYIETFGLQKAVSDINGMYAFAVYDKLEKQIHLVVDRFGQKPLYYHHSGNKFAFASSVGALMQVNDKWKIDDEGLQSYWLLGSTMGESSMISGIIRVKGSHILSYDVHKNVSSCSRYWSPQYQSNTECIEELILDSIRKVKVSDVPVYTFLSGGIDSSLVASQMEGMDAVHLDSPEHKYACEAAQKFHMNLRTVSSTDINVEECLTDYAFKSGEPSMAALIPYITAKEVSKFAKVAISANGADELFFGYDRTGEDITAKQIGHCFRDMRVTYTPKYPIYGGHPFGSDKPGRGRWWELQSYVQYDLNKTLDAASMCHGLEVRAPFLDHRLVEMALSIPEGKHWDLKLGRKAILKRMLQKMGFGNEFLTRPKLGFSLHKEPEGLQNMKVHATKWCMENGFLKIHDWNILTARDQRYLEMSCLSFYYWYQVWHGKLY
jgi:asparagine synthetase B (glutamine-hydrolysing)